METLLEEKIEIKQEQSVEKPSAILYGKKTIGFPFTSVDLEHFVKLHMEDKQAYMGRFCLKNMTEEQAKEYVLRMIFTDVIHIWTIYTKNGKSSQRAGYAYLFDVNDFCGGVGGIMDMEFAKGLTKQIRRDKYTFAEDAFRSLIRFGFENIKLHRLYTEVVESNRVSMALDLKVGFKREGIQRKAFRIGENFVNLHIFGLLKEEYKNDRV